MKAAADGPLKGILAYTEDQVRNACSLSLQILALPSFFLKGCWQQLWFGHLEYRLWATRVHHNFLCFRLSPVTSMVTAIPPPLMRVLALH